MKTAFFGLLLPLVVAASLHAEEAATVSTASRDERGFLIHEVRSPYQAGTTLIRVLTPDTLDLTAPEKVKRFPVIYVLPVEAGVENRYGDGLLEVQKLGLHNRFPAIYVAPTFSHLPWYADHPTQADIRQESHFLKVVVPFVDTHYPVIAKAEGRLLLGFSKSGWGAWSLLLRHPDTFQKAVAWDAPLMMDQPGKYGSGPIFGTVENFSGYCVSQLLKDHARQFQTDKRLLLQGIGNFRQEHEKVHALMDSLKTAHDYRDGPARKHDWHSGWVPEAVEWLVGRSP